MSWPSIYIHFRIYYPKHPKFCISDAVSHTPSFPQLASWQVRQPSTRCFGMAGMFRDGGCWPRFYVIYLLGFMSGLAGGQGSRISAVNGKKAAGSGSFGRSRVRRCSYVSHRKTKKKWRKIPIGNFHLTSTSENLLIL